MKRFAFVFTTSFVLAASVARAQTGPSVVTFTTVDAVEAQQSKLVVTGVRLGESAATTAELQPLSCGADAKCAAMLENCERLALLAMTKPGQYLLKILPSSAFSYPTCKLERVAP